MPVRLSGVAKHLLGVAAVVSLVLIARPAAAQLTFGGVSLGSPGGPPRLELGLGAFDITPSNREHAGTQAVGRIEYHFGDVLIPLFSPFIGNDVTSRGGTYTYFGFGFDINFGPNWVLTPNGAAGYYQRGSGTPLGSWWEFRTGAELDYKLENQTRIGLVVQHMSNAGLTRNNPGEQEVLLTYQIPLHW